MPSKVKEPAPVEEQQLLVPEGFPKFTRFQPGPDTVQYHTQLTGLLAALDQKIRTSNNLNAHQFAADFVMPFFALTQQWQLCSQRDTIQHTHDLAEFLASQGGGGEIDEAFAELVDSHMASLGELLKLVEPLTNMAGVAEFASLGEGGLAEKQAQLTGLIEKLNVTAHEIEAVVASALEDEDEEAEEEGEGEELFDDDEGEEE